ncbi:MAG: hypothetical protein PHI34_05800 [Acidobacteriota bacterium]|nr:hypothetical protein [Acidobacteriota bacterium]
MTQNQPSENLKTLLSILIALTAVTAALVAWQAVRVGARASSADGKAITAALDEASTEIGLSADIFANLTDARDFLVLREDAKAIKEEYLHNPAAPAHWLDEWQSEMIRARARHTQLSLDFLNTKDDHPVFEDKRFRETMRAQAASEKAIDPAPFAAAAAGHRRSAFRLVELNALFTLGIFFFTVAIKTNVRRKAVWTAAGIAFYLAATVIAFVRIVL